MFPQLPSDCLNEIFEYLEKDKVTLHSCLLVNRLWCETSVKILWRNVWFDYHVYVLYRLKALSQILGTLVSCLPIESKRLLHKNKIFIDTPTSKSPLFNYASFVKVLSIYEIDQIVQHALESQQFNTLRSLNYNKFLITQEILKMFMSQMSPLKELIYHSEFEEIPCVHFAYFPGAINCLKFLQVFICSSDLYSEFYYQLSQVCQQIQSLTIRFKAIFSNGLKDLIYLQNNLEFLTLTHSDGWTNATDISPLFTKHSNNLTKLEIRGDFPLMFISIFTNLQELILSPFGDRKDLQYVIIPQLKTFRFSYGFPEPEYLSKFLENNGGNLEELYLNASEDSLNSTIAKFCPKLKLLFTIFMEDELETLKGILNGCKLLESLKVWCGEKYLKEEQLLEIVSKYSPKNFYELKIFYICNVGKELYPKELESFFINWMNRTPQQLLSFVIIKGYNSSNSLVDNRGNLEVVEKYRSLGIFRKFRAVTFEED